MVNGLYSSGRGMTNILYKQDLSANALANTNTPGFKVTRMAARTDIKTGLDPNEDAQRQSEMQSMEFFTDWRNGTMIATGNDLDIALVGDGFVRMQTPQGERYARTLSLRVDAKGELVDLSGAKLLSTDGEPIPATGGPITVLPDGRVQVAGKDRARLALVDFPKPYTLKQEGSGRFTPYEINGEKAKPVPVSSKTTISSGTLESSNVISVEAMVQMLAFNRNYEADSKVIHAIDSTLDKAVNQVARV